MQQLPDNSFDIAIADPPYNVSKGNKWSWDSSANVPGFGGNWTKFMAQWDDMSLGQYMDFSIAWISQLKRIIKPTGSIWVHGTYHNIGLVNFVLQMLEVEIINEVIWYKRNSFPNLSGRRLTASHETILWAHTGSSKSRKYNFNYEKSKEMTFPGDMMKLEGKQMRTVWDIPNNKLKSELEHGKHPTQKPLRVSKRILEISAKSNDKVLIPFAGSGTECIAAMELGLEFLAYENDPEYFELAQRRLNSHQPILNF
ncbi:llaDCHIB [Methylophaga aminisulfidivorans MP]|uniref:Methyltransferase n=2 Tax=Methylophaga aminisulfidivorans TaxID=230105 RepID=F5SZR0_9GAMM|nr:llaDCHIB [Methylophaga aminisulfidivorans MP]